MGTTTSSTAGLKFIDVEENVSTNELNYLLNSLYLPTTSSSSYPPSLKKKIDVNIACNLFPPILQPYMKAFFNYFGEPKTPSNYSEKEGNSSDYIIRLKMIFQIVLKCLNEENNWILSQLFSSFNSFKRQLIKATFNPDPPEDKDIELLPKFLKEPENFATFVSIYGTLQHIFTFTYLETLYHIYETDSLSENGSSEIKEKLSTKEEKENEQSLEDIFNSTYFPDLKPQFKSLNSSYVDFLCQNEKKINFLVDLNDLTINWLFQKLPLLSKNLSNSLYSHFTQPPPKAKENDAPTKKFHVYKQPEDPKKNLKKDLKRTSSALRNESHEHALCNLWAVNNSNALSHELIFSLIQTHTNLGEHKWIRLFANWKNGMTLKSLAKYINLHASPTIIVIKTKCNNIFGAVNFSKWVENGNRYFGDDSSFLYSYTPHFQTFKTSGIGNNYVYLNSKHKFCPLGIGFGGTLDLFRFWVDEDLIECYTTIYDTTYTKGSITIPSVSTSHISYNSIKNDMQIDVIEVWTAGGTASLFAQLEALEIQNQLREERSKVDKSRLVQSTFDKEFLFGSLFTRSHGEEYNQQV